MATTTNQQTLQSLAQGMALQQVDQYGNPCAAPVCQPPQLVQVGQPSNCTSVDLRALNTQADCSYENTFVNSTGAARELRIGTSSSAIGDYIFDPNGLTPAAQDFATFVATGDSADTGANGGSINWFNKLVFGSPVIVSEIDLQSPATHPNTAKARVSTTKYDPAGSLCNTKLPVPICQLCTDNNANSPVTYGYFGNFPVGPYNGLSIVVPNMPGSFEVPTTDSLTVKLNFSGISSCASLTAC